MAGVKGRSGRRRAIGNITAENALSAAMRSFIQALEDPNISPLEKAKLSLPIVSKRFPDKIEQTITSFNLSPELAGQFLELYRRNQAIYEGLGALPALPVDGPGNKENPLKDTHSTATLGTPGPPSLALELSPLPASPAPSLAIEGEARLGPGHSGGGGASDGDGSPLSRGDKSGEIV